MREHSFRSIATKLPAVCPQDSGSQVDYRRGALNATIVLSVMILSAALSSRAAVAKPLDYAPHFKTVFIDGNPSSNETVTVLMQENANDPRRTIKQLVPQEITIDGTYFAEMSKGYITSIDIGHITVADGHVLNVIDARVSLGEVGPDWKPPSSQHAPFSYPVNTADLPAGIRDGILNACTTTGAASFDFPIAMQVTARRYKRGESSTNKRRDNTVFGKMPIKVICQQTAQAEAPPKPFSVEVFVQQGGETCPKLTEVKARIKYQVATTSRFRFKVDGEPSKWFDIKAHKEGAVYLVEHSKTYHLDPGQHHFRVEAEGGKQSDVRTLKIDCPPFEATSMWLTLDTENKDTCPKNVDASVRINGNRPGAVLTKIKNQAGVVMAIESIKVEREGDHYVGRLTKTFNMNAIDTMLIAEDANDAALNSGWQPLKIECLEALSGKLTLSSLGDTSCKGEALVAIHTDGAGELPYELECGPGKSWQRKVTAMANKIGVDKVRFDVSNNELVTCVLRTRIGGVLKSLDGASKTFQCHKPTDAGASTDLAPETRPEDPPPVHPAVTGDFSFVDSGGTRCPRQGKALLNFELSQQSNVHYSLDCTNGHFSGVAQPVASPQGGYIAPALVSFDVNQTTHAKCALKTVAPGKPKVHALKGHVFQCVTPTGVSGSDELAPDTRPDPQQPDKPGLTVTDPQISCAGGSVKDGACVCERTMKPVKAGKNAWRCVQSVVDPKPDNATVSGPKISCAGGTVKNGACTCARTHKPVKAGKAAWRCVKIVVIDPPKDKGSANKVGVKTAPKKTAAPKSGNADKAKGGKGKGKTAKNGNGSSALR
jgi:hypothetical protein